jgi:hypothetical protein
VEWLVAKSENEAGLLLQMMQHQVLKIATDVVLVACCLLHSSLQKQYYSLMYSNVVRCSPLIIM